MAPLGMSQDGEVEELTIPEDGVICDYWTDVLCLHVFVFGT